MQFRHAIGAWALKADDHDGIGGELAAPERLFHRILIVEDAHGGFDDMPVGGDR